MAQAKKVSELWEAMAKGLVIQARYVGPGANGSEAWRDQENWDAELCQDLIKGRATELYLFRIKPRTISINGVEVPEPLRVAPAYGTTVWMVSLPSWSAHTWLGNSNDQAWLRTGLLHATEEAARAHAEALLKCSAS